MKKLLSAVALLAATSINAQEAPLSVDVYNATENSFHVTASLVYGEREALLIDTGFSRADALRIAAKVLDSGRELKTIFISQADPDYYFGVSELSEIFPDAQLLTTQAVKSVIEQKMAKKLSFWGPKLGSNAPKNPIALQVLEENVIEVDGQRIEIKGKEDALAHRPYLWIPGSKTVLGNVSVYSGLHLWTADAQSDEALTAWGDQLKTIKRLEPARVVPGHMKGEAGTGVDQVDYSIKYLERFKEAKLASKSSAELIAKMTAYYPSSKLPMALNIGAKVHMGEMKW